MNTRSRLVLGSLAGALSIHLVLVACSSGGSPPGGDAGRNGGLLADVRDALADVVADVLDAEVRDAHADGGADAGAPTCTCPTPPQPEFTFSGALLNRGMGDERPATDHSSVSVTTTTDRA